jgi:hypothetical protein
MGGKAGPVIHGSGSLGGRLGVQGEPVFGAAAVGENHFAFGFDELPDFREIIAEIVNGGGGGHRDTKVYHTGGGVKA